MKGVNFLCEGESDCESDREFRSGKVAGLCRVGIWEMGGKLENELIGSDEDRK
jgi:hypothetical protein